MPYFGYRRKPYGSMYATRRRYRRPSRGYKRSTFRNRAYRSRYRRTSIVAKRRFRRYKARNTNTKKDKYCLQYIKTIINHISTSTTWPSGGNIQPTGACLSNVTGFSMNFKIEDMLNVYGAPPAGALGNAPFFQSVVFSYYFKMYKFFRISKIVVHCSWDIPKNVLGINSGNLAGDSFISGGAGTHSAIPVQAGPAVNTIAEPQINEVGLGIAGNVPIENSSDTTSYEARYWGSITGNRGITCIWYPGLSDIGTATNTFLPKTDQMWLQQSGIRKVKFGRSFKMIWTPRIRTPIFNDPDPGAPGSFITGTTRKMPWWTTNSGLLDQDNTLQGAPFVRTIGTFVPGAVLFCRYKVYFKFRERIF